MAACHDVLPRSHLGEGVKVTGRGLLGLQRFAVRRERVDAVTPVLLIDVLVRTRGDHVIHLSGECCATRKRQRHGYNERPYDVTFRAFHSDLLLGMNTCPQSISLTESRLHQMRQHLARLYGFCVDAVGVHHPRRL